MQGSSGGLAHQQRSGHTFNLQGRLLQDLQLLTCGRRQSGEGLGSSQTAHHNVGEERIQGSVAAGAPLPADADQLHVLAGGGARHIDTQAVQVRLTLRQGLLPVPTCSERSMRMHAAHGFVASGDMNHACSGLL